MASRLQGACPRCASTPQPAPLIAAQHVPCPHSHGPCSRPTPPCPVLAGALDLPPSTRPSDDIDMHSEDDDDLFGNKSVQPPFLSMLYSQRTPARHPRLLLAPVPDSERLPSPRARAPPGARVRGGRRAPRDRHRGQGGRGQVPNLPVPKPSDGDVRAPPLRLFTPSHFINRTWVIRMPNYVKVDSKPFHPDSYIALNTTTTRVCTMPAARRV